MSPLVYVVFVCIALLALVAIGWIHLLDKLDGKGQYQPTIRQRRAWDRERYDLNPALRRGPRSW